MESESGHQSQNVSHTAQWVFTTQSDWSVCLNLVSFEDSCHGNECL